MNWSSFFAFTLLTAFTPGPNNIMAMSCASRYGMRKTLPFILGIFTGLCVVTLLCSAFCGALSAAIPSIEWPMKIIGAGYILYLAYKTLTSNAGVKESSKNDYRYGSGMVLQFVNPKLYLYCIVSMQTYILPFFQGQWFAVAGFALLLSAICFASILCWSAFGTAFKVLFSKHAKIVNTVMAVLLVYCAVSLFL